MINRPAKPQSFHTKPSKMKQKIPATARKQLVTEPNDLAVKFLRKYEAHHYDTYNTQKAGKRNERDKSLIERVTDAGVELSRTMVPRVKNLAKKGGEIYKNIKSSFFNQSGEAPPSQT